MDQIIGGSGDRVSNNQSNIRVGVYYMYIPWISKRRVPLFVPHGTIRQNIHKCIIDMVYFIGAGTTWNNNAPIHIVVMNNVGLY